MRELPSGERKQKINVGTLEQLHGVVVFVCWAGLNSGSSLRLLSSIGRSLCESLLTFWKGSLGSFVLDREEVGGECGEIKR